jgi:hypothetical protein
MFFEVLSQYAFVLVEITASRRERTATAKATCASRVHYFSRLTLAECAPPVSLPNSQRVALTPQVLACEFVGGSA